MEIIRILYPEILSETVDSSACENVEKLFSGKIPVYFEYDYNKNTHLEFGKKLGDLHIVFPKLENEIIEKEAEKLANIREKFTDDSKQKEEVTEMPELVAIEDFSKMDFRVAEVKSVEKVTGADKLLKMIIDVGGEERQIVSGIAEYYKPEDLIGKQIVVLVNLKPAKIRGEISNGMLLAAQHNGELVLVTTDNYIQSGSKIS